MLLWKMLSSICNIVKSKTYNQLYIYIAKSDALQSTNKDSLIFLLGLLSLILDKNRS